MKLEILPKITGVPDFPIDLNLKWYPARLCLLEVTFLTCAEDVQLLGSEPCILPAMSWAIFEVDVLEHQKSKAPANFDIHLNASWRAKLPGTYKFRDWRIELSTNKLIWEDKWPPKLCNTMGSIGKMSGEPLSRSMKNNQEFFIFFHVCLISEMGTSKSWTEKL